jgi:hypothetical protein
MKMNIEYRNPSASIQQKKNNEITKIINSV